MASMHRMVTIVSTSWSSLHLDDKVDTVGYLQAMRIAGSLLQNVDVYANMLVSEDNIFSFACVALRHPRIMHSYVELLVRLHTSRRRPMPVRVLHMANTILLNTCVRSTLSTAILFFHAMYDSSAEYREAFALFMRMSEKTSIVSPDAFQRCLHHVLSDCNLDLSWLHTCLLYTSPSPRDGLLSRMPSSA